MSHINYKFYDFMKQRYNNFIEERFKRENNLDLNSRIRKDFYSLDDLGIPIRCMEKDHDTCYGWKLFNNKFLHYQVNESLIGIINDEDLKMQTLRLIKNKHPSEFVNKGKMKSLLTIKYGEAFLQQI